MIFIPILADTDMVRLFIAVEISDKVRDNIAKLQKELLPPDNIKLVDPEKIHITLKFLGATDESKIPKIKKELAGIKFSSIKLKCKGVGVFPSEKFIRVVWCGLEEDEGFKQLKEVAAEVERRMMAMGFEKNDYPFSPHLTIGRPRDKIDLATFLKKHKSDEFGDFTVNEIKLKKSTLTPKGPIYEDL